MFSKFFTVAAVAMTFSIQVQAHAAISPVLGLNTAPVRADVQQPSTATPCGTTNIASTIDTSTPVVAGADGSFVVNVTNFNTGEDGSRQVALTVDATGTGKSFVAGTVSKNGVLAPQDVTSEQVTASLPPDTKCAGGASGDLCLASFKTAGGFGNCVVVQQAAATGTTAASNSTVVATSVVASASATSVSTTVADSASTAATAEASSTKKHHHHHKDKNATTAAVGTRAARAVLAGFDSQERHAKRSLLSWIWA